jgi:hypothetical protein
MILPSVMHPPRAAHRRLEDRVAGAGKRDDAIGFEHSSPCSSLPMPAVNADGPACSTPREAA